MGPLVHHFIGSNLSFLVNCACSLHAMTASLPSRLSPRTSTAFSFIEDTSVCDFVHSPDLPEVQGHEVDGETSQQIHTAHSSGTRIYGRPTEQESTSDLSEKKTQLQNSNVRLLELLQSIQEELDMQRKLMRDIEYETCHSKSITTTAQCRDSPIPSSSQSCKSQLKDTGFLPIESSEGFAQNCERKFNRIECLHQPGRLSTLGFDFNFTNENVQTVSVPSPNTTPDLNNLLGPTPDLADDEDLRIATALSFPQVPNVTAARTQPGTPTTLQITEHGSDNPQHIIDMSHFMIPTPPRPQSPQRNSKRKLRWLATEENMENITALPQLPSQTSTPEVCTKKQGHHRNIKSFFRVKTLLKSNCLDKARA